MDLKVLCAVVCFYALTIASTEAGIPKCCFTTRRDIPKSLLLNVQRWEEQPDTFACNIEAVILYVKDQKKPICAPPEIRHTLRRLRYKRRPRSYAKHPNYVRQPTSERRRRTVRHTLRRRHPGTET